MIDLSGWWTVHGTFWLKAYGFAITREEYKAAQERVRAALRAATA